MTIDKTKPAVENSRPERHPTPILSSERSDSTRHSWLLIQTLHSILHSVYRAWQELGAERRKEWLVPLTWGWILCGLFSLVLTQLGRWIAGQGGFNQEEMLLRRILEFVPLSFASARSLGVVGDTLFLSLAMLTAVLVLLALGKTLRSFALLAALPMTTIIVGIGWLTWDRARPEIVSNGIAAPPLHSFPSGHIVHSTVFYGLLTYYWISATHSTAERILAVLVFIAVITIVGLTRLEQGTHWPSDIIGGLLIAFAWLFSLIVTLRRAEKYQPQG